MKKIITLICALVGLTANVSAATIDDVAVCKHSYVLVMDDFTNNGLARPGKGNLFGDGFFLDVTGGSVATNKGNANPAEELTEEAGGGYRYGEAFAKKYGEYGAHLNSLRIKNAQDVIAMKVTAGSKLIFLLNGNNKSGTGARIPKIATDEKLTAALNDAPGADFEATPAGFKYEWTAKDDNTIYIGSYNGDAFLSYIIVEANEAPGTPSVKVGDQKFENGIYYREVTCKPNTYDLMGTTLNTVVTYTTDGTAPTAESTIYTAPIKCYKDMTVKFQAFIDYGAGTPDEICPSADNEGIVSFAFNAPTISLDETTNTVTFTSEYAEQGANVEYYYSYGDVKDQAGSSFTLSSSATVTAYTKIVNGSYDTFTSQSSIKDVYVLNTLNDKKTISVTTGTAVKDAEASVTAGYDIYVIEGGAISADPMDFFVKDLEFGAIANVDEANVQYQVPAGQEAYIKMNATNITFKLGQSAAVVVTCSKNACKNIASETQTDRQCKVNVDGTVYGSDDILVAYDLKAAGSEVVEETLDGNIIKFDLAAGTHTFQKFSGTGNILISSIVITPGETVFSKTGVSEVSSETAAPAASYKVAKDGSIIIVKGNAEYSAAGAQMK